MIGLLLDHVSIQCRDLAASPRFCDAVLAPPRWSADHGRRRRHRVRRAAEAELLDRPPGEGEGFGETHLAFSAPDRATVQAFFDAAVELGAEVLHEPRVWPEHHPNYFGAFVRDPDGNNVEAVCHGPE